VQKLRRRAVHDHEVDFLAQQGLDVGLQVRNDFECSEVLRHCREDHRDVDIARRPVVAARNAAEQVRSNDLDVTREVGRQRLRRCGAIHGRRSPTPTCLPGSARTSGLPRHRRDPYA
jgi:hypothetical protein